MSIEKNNAKFMVAKRKKFTSNQVAIECNVEIETGDEIQKILTVWATAVVENTNATNTDLTINGKTVVNMIFLTKENTINSQSSVCPFVSKETGEDFENTKTHSVAKVIETSVESITPTGAKVLVVVEVDTFVYKNEEVPLYVAGDDICTKESSLTSMFLVAEKNASFNEDNQLQTKENIKKVLCVESGIVLKDYTAGYNFVSIQGDIATRVIYVVDDDGVDKLQTSYITNTFKQDVEFDNISKDVILNIDANIKYDEMQTTLEQGEFTGLTVKIPVSVKMLAFEKKDYTTVSDLYSTTNSVNAVTQSYEGVKVLSNEYFENKIEGSFTLSEEYPRVDKLIAVAGCNLTQSNTYYEDGEIFVEGVANATVTYLNDELSNVNSVQIEFPFVVSTKSDKFEEEVETNSHLMLTDIDVLIKKGRDVYFDAKLKGNICIYCEEKGAVITDLNLGDSLAEKDAPIEIYFAKQGDNIWDICKEMKIKEDELFNQNPNLTDPLEQDEKIVLYYQKRQ